MAIHIDISSMIFAQIWIWCCRAVSHNLR